MITDQTNSHHLQNYGAFMRLSQEERVAHDGEYALFSEGRIIAYYRTNKEAILAAFEQGLQEKFSVMCVRPQPEDMGLFDCANYPR